MNASRRPPAGSRAGAPTVSVCMATYNGARYVAAQLTSILDQLGADDEVVVVDDASTDDTVERLRELGDPRIRVVEAPHNRGYVATFAQALGLASRDVVLLADQDDVWVAGRVDLMVGGLAQGEVVAANLGTLDGPAAIRGPYGQRDWRLRSDQSRQHVRNVLGILAGNRPYYGCAMGVRRSSLERVLPFPGFLTESHDLWIALYGNVARSIVHLDDRTVLRRFHGENVTPDRPRGLVQVARSRLLLLRGAAILWHRTHR